MEGACFPRSDILLFGCFCCGTAPPPNPPPSRGRAAVRSAHPIPLTDDDDKKVVTAIEGQTLVTNPKTPSKNPGIIQPAAKFVILLDANWHRETTILDHRNRAVEIAAPLGLKNFSLNDIVTGFTGRRIDEG